MPRRDPSPYVITGQQQADGAEAAKHHRTNEKHEPVMPTTPPNQSRPEPGSARGGELTGRNPLWFLRTPKYGAVVEPPGGGMSNEELDLDRVVQGTLLGEAVLNATVAALVADDAGQYIAANDEVCRLTGYDRAQLTASRMGSLAADARSAQIYANIARGQKLQGRKQVRRNDGKVLSCRYWAIETTVALIPYFVILLWPHEPLPSLAG
jgi:PAS domain S-box-containing protein